MFYPLINWEVSRSYYLTVVILVYFSQRIGSQSYLQVYSSSCIADSAFPPVVDEYSLDTCYRLKLSSNSTNYVKKMNADDWSISLRRNIFTRNSTCGVTPKLTQDVLKTSYLCVQNSQAKVISSRFQLPSNTYAKIR